MMEAANYQALQEEIESTLQEKYDKEDWRFLKTIFFSLSFSSHIFVFHFGHIKKSLMSMTKSLEYKLNIF